MKFILILMMTSYGGSFEHVIFYDKPACEAAFKALKESEPHGALKGGCFPYASE
jgi:hypothetical protein